MFDARRKLTGISDTTTASLLVFATLFTVTVWIVARCFGPPLSSLATVAMSLPVTALAWLRKNSTLLSAVSIETPGMQPQ
jgi:hypothetical protein